MKQTKIEIWRAPCVLDMPIRRRRRRRGKENSELDVVLRKNFRLHPRRRRGGGKKKQRERKEEKIGGFDQFPIDRTHTHRSTCEVSQIWDVIQRAKQNLNGRS